jgi:hypothetical protein
LAASLGLSSIDCTGPTAGERAPLVDEAGVANFRLVEPDDHTAPHAACRGLLLRGPEHRLENLQRTLTAYLCVDGAAEDSTIVNTDAAGRLVDLDVLLAEDQAAFEEQFHSIDPDLQQNLDTLNYAELVELSVWYRFDQSDVPNKEALLADPALARQVEFELDDRMRLGAFALRDTIEAIPVPRGLPPITIQSELAATSRMRAPELKVVAPRGLIEAIGDLRDVVWVGDGNERQEPASEAYFWTDVQHVLDDAGFDGTGITVAIFEQHAPDFTIFMPDLPTGSCLTNSGNFVKCFCSSGEKRAHSRIVGGVIRSSTLSLSFGGMADEASLIFANGASPYCSTSPSPFAARMNWALDEGARIINHSECPPGTTAKQSARDRWWDHVASSYPFPLIVAATGNAGNGNQSCNKLFNGLVVGGSTNTGGRPQGLFSGSQGTNWSPSGSPAYAGHELPHVVAPAVNVATAGGSVFQSTGVFSGTSMAVPQISGVAAAVMEMNPAVKSWPEAFLPGLMVGVNSDGNADGAAWPLNLGDAVDDQDGAGLVNAFVTALALASGAKKNGGNAASATGHDYGYISSPPVGFYAETWNASVAPGATLRAASVLFSRPTCGSQPSETNCTSNPYPLYALYIHEGSTLRAISYNTNQNYQFASTKNTSALAKNYTIRLYITSWAGLPLTTFGVAWSSY